MNTAYLIFLINPNNVYVLGYNENIKDYIAVLFIKQGQVVLFFEFFLKFVTRRKYIDVLKFLP